MTRRSTGGGQVAGILTVWTALLWSACQPIPPEHIERAGEWSAARPAFVYGPLAPIVEDTVLVPPGGDCTHPEQGYSALGGSPPFTLCMGRSEASVSIFLVDATDTVRFASARGPTARGEAARAALGAWRSRVETMFGPPARTDVDIICWRVEPYTVTVHLLPPDDVVTMRERHEQPMQVRLMAERPTPSSREC